MWLSCIPSSSRTACQKDQSHVSCWWWGMSWAGVGSLHWLDGGEKRAERSCLITAKYQPEDLQQPGSRISEIPCGAHLSRALAALKWWWSGILQEWPWISSTFWSSTLTQMDQNKSPPVHQHIFPISLPAHDSSTPEHFVSHPSQRVTTGNVCVSVWAGQVYGAGCSTVTSPASMGSQHLLNSNVHSRHTRDTNSQCCFAAHRLLWTLTRLQKRSVQVEQNPPLKPCQIWWWTAVLDLCSSADLQLQYRHSP